MNTFGFDMNAFQKYKSEQEELQTGICSITPFKTFKSMR